GVASLRAIAGRPRVHRFLQRRAVADEPAGAGAIVRALAGFLTGGQPSLETAWRLNGAPASALVPEATRHPGEVRRLLDRLRLVGLGGLALAGLVLGLRSAGPRPLLRTAGWISTVAGLTGLAGALANFPRLFQTYHDVAYDNEDWRLPADNDL